MSSAATSPAPETTPSDPSDPAAIAPVPSTTPWPSVLRLSLILSAVVAIFVLAFAWPGIAGEPRDLPVAVVGDEAQVGQVERALEQQQPGAFTFTPVADRDAAVGAIEQREVYGAIVLGREPEVLTATAAAPAVSQILGQVASGLEDAAAQRAASGGAGRGGGGGSADAAAPSVTRTDVVPFSPDDPRGAGFGGALLPLVLGGMIAGIALTLSVDGVARRVGGLLVIAVAAGLLVTLVMHTWLDVLPGGFLATAGVFTLAVLAIGAPIAGFASIIGRAGIAIGPVLFMLIGNPIAGGTSPEEFLPGPWGAIGQLMPPGRGRHPAARRQLLPRRLRHRAAARAARVGGRGSAARGHRAPSAADRRSARRGRPRLSRPTTRSVPAAQTGHSPRTGGRRTLVSSADERTPR